MRHLDPTLDPRASRAYILRTVWNAIKAHPVITVVCAAFTVGGALAALWLAPEDWVLWRKLGAGATTGAFFAFTIVAARSLGAFKISETDDPR